MKKFALISLRNDLIVNRKERRDSIDIEIYNLVFELGYIPILLPNEPTITDFFELIFKENNIALILLTGGNDIDKFKNKNGSNLYFKRDKLELNLIDYCISKSIPILSICRGFQLIANYLGGNIEKIEGHVDIVHEISLINLKEKINVNSFHSYGLKNNKLPSMIKPFALYKKDNTIEGFTTIEPFKSFNIMWHPERANGSRVKTLKLIKSFI